MGQISAHSVLCSFQPWWTPKCSDYRNIPPVKVEAFSNTHFATSVLSRSHGEIDPRHQQRLASTHALVNFKNATTCRRR